jgi:hypothetical protein
MTQVNGLIQKIGRTVKMKEVIFGLVLGFAIGFCSAKIMDTKQPITSIASPLDNVGAWADARTWKDGS